MIEELILTEKLDRGPFLNDYPNSEDLHAQECTHMNDIAYHVCPDFKKKRKEKIDLPTLPIFGPKGQTNIFFFRRYRHNTVIDVRVTRSSTFATELDLTR